MLAAMVREGEGGRQHGMKSLDFKKMFWNYVGHYVVN